MPGRKKTLYRMPVLALRAMLIYPGTMTHFDVGREKSVVALQKAMTEDQKIFLVSQRDDEVEDPGMDDLYAIGTIASVKQILNLPGNAMRVLVEGEQRAELVRLNALQPALDGTVRLIAEADMSVRELQALVASVQDILAEYALTSQKISSDNMEAVGEIRDADTLADFIGANILTDPDDRRKIMDLTDPAERLEYICTALAKANEIAALEKQIQVRVRQQVEKNQKDYYLREQVKAIQEELGDKEETDTSELRERMEKTPLNEEARKKCEKELDRLERMAPGNPEIGVSRTYIEWILDLPWGKLTEDDLDLKRAAEVLDKDHYGLSKVKERIIEHLAVLGIRKDMKGPILCLVGPPGVGKTSIVRAIAEAMGRKFVQMSLGGVRDEAEIRGHRRTYVGSVPGRILYGLKTAESMNPVFLFDEIDKMSSDYRGDPASALLEVLDSEQNDRFRDHYLELPFDLSKVLFITTANSVDGIPGPLLDRMEIIEVSSYTEEEKLQILRRHLLPKQLKAHGLGTRAVKMSEKIMKRMIEDYTREAGVRTLERTLAKVIRKCAVRMLENGAKSMTVTEPVLHEMLGAARYTRENMSKQPLVGVVNGLAYTSVGGEMLEIECQPVPGKGTLRLTGQLGDVMKESAETALTCVRSRAGSLGICSDFMKDTDLHIHAPEGAVPKDGPSAGVTFATAIVSAMTGIPVKNDVAMTGEITLRGRVLPIGGLKEKSMAAYRAGIHTLIIPAENHKDLEEIPETVRSSFRVVEVADIDGVLANSLTRMPAKENQ